MLSGAAAAEPDLWPNWTNHISAASIKTSEEDAATLLEKRLA